MKFRFGHTVRVQAVVKGEYNFSTWKRLGVRNYRLKLILHWTHNLEFLNPLFLMDELDISTESGLNVRYISNKGIINKKEDKSCILDQ